MKSSRQLVSGLSVRNNLQWSFRKNTGKFFFGAVKSEVRFAMNLEDMSVGGRLGDIRGRPNEQDLEVESEATPLDKKGGNNNG